jgi:hypothetical protein
MDAPSVVLLQHDLFLIVAERRVVWCRVLTPPHINPGAGAAAGKSAFTYLMSHVLVRRSSWLGVVLDVRRGPSVVGPITFQGLEGLFSHAEEVRKPFAVLIGSATAQREQFGKLQLNAPRFTLVTTEPADAVGWMTRAG